MGCDVAALTSFQVSSTSLKSLQTFQETSSDPVDFVSFQSIIAPHTASPSLAQSLILRVRSHADVTARRHTTVSGSNTGL